MEHRPMKKYYERVDELITNYGGQGKLNENSGFYEFVFGDSKEDTLAWSGEDFVGVQSKGTITYIPLSRLVFDLARWGRPPVVSLVVRA
jgi:hypothetical protein